MNVKEFLRNLDEFARLGEEDLDRLAGAARVRQAKAGTLIDVQGQPAEKFYILQSGRYAVILDVDIGVARRSYMVTTLGPGQMFGWSAMVGNPTYTASGKALTDCTVLEFDAKELNNMFEDDPRLGYAVMKGVARTIASRLRHMQLQLVQQYAATESEE